MLTNPFRNPFSGEYPPWLVYLCLAAGIVFMQVLLAIVVPTSSCGELPMREMTVGQFFKCVVMGW
jgi:hypothetical protein